MNKEGLPHINGYRASCRNGQWVYVQDGTGDIFTPEEIAESDKIDNAKLRADTDLLLIMTGLYEGE